MMQMLMVTAVPVLLVVPVLGQEKMAPKSEEAVVVKKPVVTFYYFDG